MKVFRPNKKEVLPNRRTTDKVRRRLDTAEPTSYRRNRTLTGSTSARVSSSNETKAEFQSPRAHVHHLNHLRRRLIGYSLVILVAVVTLYVLVNQLIAQVDITATAASLPATRSQAYAGRLSDYLSTRPVERLRFLLNTDELTSFMQQRYPEISSIQLESSGQFGKIDASVGLRQPIARWSINDQNKFVDRGGIVFNYNAYSSPSISIVDHSGVPTTGIRSVASSSFLTFVGRVVGDSAERGHTVKSATIPALSIRELDIRIKGLPYRFKMTTDRPAGEQVEDMSRIIRYLHSKGIKPGYVDVRLEGKAFYK